MHIDWSTLALQTVNALVLLWLLGRFLFKPVAQIIAQRQQAAQTLIADANDAKRAAQAEREAAQRETGRVADERAGAMAAIEAEAAAQKVALLEAAQADADKLRADAAAEVEHMRAATAQVQAAQAARLAVEIAGKLLARLPEETRVAAFIDGTVQALDGLSAPIRAELGTAADPLRLVAPRSLTPEEQSRCETALAATLHRSVVLDLAVDPTLIAGLELTSAHAVVRNHFRHDLEQIEAALVEQYASPE